MANHPNRNKVSATDQELMGKAINWWRKKFPECQLRPSVNVSAVLRGKRLHACGENDAQGRRTKSEGPYVLLRSHDGGAALPLHSYTICGLFRWNGRKLTPVLIIDGHASRFVDPDGGGR